MSDLAFKCPLNNLSFGNVSINLLREMYNADMDVSVFPIGENADLSVFDKLTDDFKSWLQDKINNRVASVQKDTPTLQLWHINGSENRITRRHFFFLLRVRCANSY